MIVGACAVVGLARAPIHRRQAAAARPPVAVHTRSKPVRVLAADERQGILQEHGDVMERRRQLRHPVYAKPALIAEGPNQVWSWDITKLTSPAKMNLVLPRPQALLTSGPTGLSFFGSKGNMRPAARKPPSTFSV